MEVMFHLEAQIMMLVSLPTSLFDLFCYLYFLYLSNGNWLMLEYCLILSNSRFCSLKIEKVYHSRFLLCWWIWTYHFSKTLLNAMNDMNSKNAYHTPCTLWHCNNSTTWWTWPQSKW